MSWSNLEHQVHKKILALGEGQQFLLAVSGGLDSVALLCCFHRLGVKFSAFHFHHGPGENQPFRDQAQSFVQALCDRLSVPLISRSSKNILKSEAELRLERYRALREVQSEGRFHFIVLAHHQDDLLETRLMRLLRGTGHQGLSGMEELSQQNLFRPFLDVSKVELKNYLVSLGQDHLEDPSNQEVEPLRNWLREVLLPEMEAKQAGMVGALARSLETLVQEWEASRGENAPLLQQNQDLDKDGINRLFYESLPLPQRKMLLAQYLLALKKRDFSQSQLNEVVKRLDKPEKVHSFKVAGLTWSVNAGQIKVLD